MAIVCTALMAALLVFSDAAMAAARTALACFGSGVLPALLPMMVLGKMLPDAAGTRRRNAAGWLGTALFGFAAGSPASAQRLAPMRGGMSRRGWECLLCLTGVMSPMFFTGTLAGWLHSARDGWVLLGVHWLGAAATAMLWALTGAGRDERPSQRESTGAIARPGLPEIITQCAQSLLSVLGAMMIFSVAASLLKSVCGAMFPAWTARHADWMAVLWAVMEIGGGSAAVIEQLKAPHAALGALCGFGGLSIFLQNMLFLHAKIRPARLLAMRAVHGAVCYAIIRLLNPF